MPATNPRPATNPMPASNSAEGDSATFSPEVVSAVVEHMNADHVGDMVLICASRAGIPGITAVRLTGLDHLGANFEAEHHTSDGESITTLVRVPWSAPLRERHEIRSELVRLVEEARSG